ncbi:MAG: LysR substrate-binding domain-containing protein, partial [Burkholderia sp.]
ARAVLGSLEQAQEELDALKAGHLGHVAIGTITSPGVRLLPAAIAAVKKQHPAMRISIEIETSNVLLERLAQDKLDIVVGRLSAEHDKLPLRYETLADEFVHAVVRQGHPLLGGPALTLAEVREANWVVPPAGSVLRHRFERMFQRASLAPPARIVETAALLFITRLLEESDMIAVLAADVAQYYAAHRVVEILPLAMQCQMDDYGLITRSDRLPTPAAAIVTDALRAAGGLLSGN